MSEDVPLRGEEKQREWTEALYVQTSRSYKEHISWADETAAEVSLRIAGCLNAISTATTRAFTAAGFTGSRARYSVLRSLFFAESHRLSHAETSRKVGVSPGTLTRVVDGMESDGLVTRVTDPIDRRFTQLQLTEAGEGLAASLVPVITRLRNEIFATFSDEEKRILNGLLRRVQAGADSLGKSDLTNGARQ
jgi:DNA-binding MarR family transcriptional regulator